MTAPRQKGSLKKLTCRFGLIGWLPLHVSPIATMHHAGAKERVGP